ncbi:hypothetical protein [Psychrosphaera algicola]|uniref:Type I restriction modification DNA specificity domain-containing protein n=1 Tax=Psychrosphaera algicola TaxID=3023714 RepID=A0ABT5FGZ5_9GAMM|nr:hypothetical protein [Psychrosphaera sp. G1-22]MDC2890375.1 hypothetical protein [Psychrosphaera sp. G1-22]
MNQAPAQKYFEEMAEGSWQVGINKSTILSLKISIPDIEKQYKVVALANTFLKEKEILQALIENRETQIKGVAQQLL